MAKRPTNDIGGQAANGRNRDLMAAGRMAERGETFGQPDERHQAPPSERKRYPKEDIRGLIDKIPQPDNNYPSVLGNVKGLLHGINNVLGATDNAVNGEEFDEKEFIGGVAELGIGATRLNTMAAGAGGAAASTVSMFGARAARDTLKPNRSRGNATFRTVNEDAQRLDDFNRNAWDPEYANMSPYQFENQRFMETGFVENPALLDNPMFLPDEEKYLKWIPNQNIKFSDGNDVRGLYSRLDENNPSAVMRLPDYVDHPELYKYYPELRDVNVKIHREVDPRQRGYSGMYDPVKREISLNLGVIGGDIASILGDNRFMNIWDDPVVETMLNNKILQVLFHEVQHGVQDIDSKSGFRVGVGSNTQMAFESAIKKLGDVDHILRSDPSGMNYRDMKLHNDLKVAFLTMQDVFKTVTNRSGQDFIDIMTEIGVQKSFAGKRIQQANSFTTRGIDPDVRTEYIDKASYALYRKDLGEAQAEFVEGTINNPWDTRPNLDEELVYNPNAPLHEQSIVTDN